jgi:phosphatidylglycerophosphate synthase
VLPNLITGLRLLLLPPLFVCLVLVDSSARWAALGLYLFAGLTDVLDGRIARATGQTSVLGAALDLMADRLLTLTAVLGLLAGGSMLPGPALAALVVIGRGFVVSALERVWGERLNITVNGPEKIKIALQFAGLALMMAPWAPGFPQEPDNHEVGGWLFIASAGITLVTLALYIRRAARISRRG